MYRATAMSGRGQRKATTVCVKICASADDWHCEAHFGNLLSGYSEVVELLDSFAFGTGAGRRTRYVLVTEYMPEGTVADLADDRDWRGWTPGRVRREISRLLKVLALMHASGVTHRDIKPANVFIRDGHLVLGDFGISKHSLTPRRSAIDAYTPAYSPNNMDERQNWATWVDIYQVGLLAGTLLTGNDFDSSHVGGIRYLDIPDDLKCWMWHATAHHGLRYVSGLQASQALRQLRDVDMRDKSGPKSIRGHHVTLTGRFATGSQRKLAQMISRARWNRPIHGHRQDDSPRPGRQYGEYGRGWRGKQAVRSPRTQTSRRTNPCHQRGAVKHIAQPLTRAVHSQKMADPCRPTSSS